MASLKSGVADGRKTYAQPACKQHITRVTVIAMRRMTLGLAGALCLVVASVAGCSSDTSDAQGAPVMPATGAEVNPASPAPVPERTGQIPFPSPGDVYGPMSSVVPPGQDSVQSSPDAQTQPEIPSPPPPPPLPPASQAATPGGMPQAESCRVGLMPGPSSSSAVLEINYVGQPTAVWAVVRSAKGTESGPIDVIPGLNQRVIPGVDFSTGKVSIFNLPAGPTGAPVCSSP